MEKLQALTTNAFTLNTHDDGDGNVTDTSSPLPDGSLDQSKQKNGYDCDAFVCAFIPITRHGVPLYTCTVCGTGFVKMEYRDLCRMHPYTCICIYIVIIQGNMLINIYSMFRSLFYIMVLWYYDIMKSDIILIIKLLLYGERNIIPRVYSCRDG